MTAAQKTRIDSTKALLVWLQGGRKLAHNVLRDAGASAALIRLIDAKPMAWYRAPNSSTLTDPASGAKLPFTNETAAAVLMLDCCDSVAAKVQDAGTPAHVLVLEGYNLATYEDAMKAAHWTAEAEREKQRKRGAKKRGPRLPAAMASELRSQGTTWNALKRRLPTRVGQSVVVDGFRFTFQDDGRLVITYNKKSSPPVKAETLRGYFSRTTISRR
jgi:hypothetical protein